jgi:hypothetical protein
VSNILNIEAIHNASMVDDPYPYAPYVNTFSEVDSLLNAFPDNGFEYHAQRRLLENLGRKDSPEWYQHNVCTRALLTLGETTPHEPAGLADVWLALAEDIVSAEYREALTELTGFDVRPYPSQTHFWSFEGGASFKPHVDKSHKMVTHLMYLTENWEPSIGGSFQVLGSGDSGDVVAEFPPYANHSLVLRRTDNAWHSVTGIPRDSRPRRLVQTWFWVS